MLTSQFQKERTFVNSRADQFWKTWRSIRRRR
jgi:hypothetical protein